MNALIFVNSQREVEKIDIMVKSTGLDFSLTTLDSFEYLMQHFESSTVDVFICQLGLKNCNALELLQLARMYNPEVINMATGDENCIDELVRTFNQENLFRFISMPWQHKNDIIEPIKEAMDSLHNKVQMEYDTKALEEDGVHFRRQIEALTGKDATLDKMYDQCPKLLNRLLRQAYFFAGDSSNRVKDSETEFNVFAFETYNTFFFRRLGEVNTVIHEMLDKYRDPSNGRYFSVKHNLTDEPADDIRAKMLYCLSLLTEYFFRTQTEYKISTVIGFVNNRYLIKYEFKFMDPLIKEFEDSLESHCYRMLQAYIKEVCNESEFALTETGLEIRIIVA